MLCCAGTSLLLRGQSEGKQTENARNTGGGKYGTFYYQSYGIKKSRDRTARTGSAPHTDVGCGEVVEQAGRIVIVQRSYCYVDDATSLIEG